MFNSMTVSAPAKINIGLQVLPRREDGYHDIKSIFTTVSLHDTLTVSLTDSKNRCDVECEELKLPDDNTFTKAYKAFCVLTGIDRGVHVKVTKRIPSGGGLGGGSSDASSFIQSIDTLFGTKLSAPSLELLAGKVGSDVYFFTDALLSDENPYAAFVEGRGERVQRIQPRTDYSVVLVFPQVSVSTKDAYSWVDEAMSQRNPETNPLSMSELLSEYGRDVCEWRFCNDFTVPVIRHNPVIGNALADLRRCGAGFADMSGSGSTVFGVFNTKDGAVRALEILTGKWRAMLV